MLFRVAARSLLRTPGYTIIALITLVLGIGANTTVFSLISGVLLNPLPFSEPERLVRVNELNATGGDMQVAWQNFVDWRSRATSFDRLAAHTPGGEGTVLVRGRAVRVATTAVSEGFFDAFAVRPELGRATLPEEHRIGGRPVAVVSRAFWRDQLNSNPRLDGITVNIDGVSSEVVGVLPAAFDYPSGTAVWHPIELEEQNTSRTSHNFLVVGKLRSGSTLAAADAELDAITKTFMTASAAEAAGFESYFPASAHVVSLHEALVGSTKRPLYVLLGAALLVLLLACTNLTSTTLARGAERERDFAVRHALGGSYARVAAAMFAETALLALAGCAIALALAAMVLNLLPGLLPAGLPRMQEVRLDPRVLAFTIVLSLLAALLSGAWPALRLSRRAMLSLRSARGTETPHHQRVWKLLIGAETAFALVLLIGAGLLMRSFNTILAVQPGFRTEGILTGTLNPPIGKYSSMQLRREYFERLKTTLAAIPGVQSAGLVMAPPMQWVPNGQIEVDGGPKANISAEYQLADAEYFRALDIPLLRGRMMAATDRENTEPVVVVNRALAELAWPGQDPIGKRITGGGMDDHWEKRTWATVVGVVGDIRQRDLTRPARPTFYFAYTQRPFRTWSMTAVIRPASGDATSLTSTVRSAIASIDPEVPASFATMQQRVGDALTTRRFIMSLTGVFALIALLLATVGVFGVVNYAVTRRRREIGIRVALGARAHNVRTQIQRDYFLPIAGGVVLGIAGALALTRAMSGLLYEVRPTDPVTFAAVTALLGAVGWLASFIPALRTSRLDPLETMRGE